MAAEKPSRSGDALCIGTPDRLTSCAAAQDPIDFSTIRQRLEAGSYYRTLSLFTADVRHLCQNARVYNSAETFYYKAADKLEAQYDQLLNGHLVFDSAVAQA